MWIYRLKTKIVQIFPHTCAHPSWLPWTSQSSPLQAFALILFYTFTHDLKQKKKTIVVFKHYF